MHRTPPPKTQLSLRARAHTRRGYSTSRTQTALVFCSRAGSSTEICPAHPHAACHQPRDASSPPQQRSILSHSNCVYRKSILAETRQLNLNIRNDKSYVDGFVRELIFAERLYKNSLGDKITPATCLTSPFTHNDKITSTLTTEFM